MSNYSRKKNTPSVSKKKKSFWKNFFTKKKQQSRYETIPLASNEYKKFIVYVSTPKNISFIESMDAQERHKVFNEFIELAQEKTNKEIHLQIIRNYIVHLMIIILTVIMSLPLLLFLCNKAYDYTVNSYADSIKNFEKLYQDRQRK